MVHAKPNKTFLFAFFFLLVIVLFSVLYLFPPEMKKNEVLDLKTIDAKVKPANDFYLYAVGRWIDKTTIPKDKAAWNFFNSQMEKNYLILRQIMQTAAKNKDQRSEEYKVGTFFTLGMDDKKIEKEGLTPLQPYLGKIDQIKDLNSLSREMARLHLYTCGPFFDFGPMTDPTNSHWRIAAVSQGGLGLPDRDYYLKKEFGDIRIKYKKYVNNIFTLYGLSSREAALAATTIMKIETDLAEASMDRLSLRDPYKTLHKMKIKELQALSPNFNWPLYLNEMGFPKISSLNVCQPGFFRGFSLTLKKYKMDELKIYLRFCLLNAFAPYLNDAYVKENFNFYARELSGVQELAPRWKRVINTANGALGQAVGKLYVKETFPPAAKKRMLALVANLLSATRQRISRLDWMSAPSKQEALKKLSRLRVKIGYPDKWIDYAKLDIKNDSYLANIIRAGYFNYSRELNEIGQPVDQTKWLMPPQTVNAYYSPPQNEIVFPAGILQPIMFNLAADDAVNYGAIGTVIAHEITHGFDDQGRKYDAQGNLRDWWTKKDALTFRARTKVLVDQYNAFEPLKGMHLNGQLTLGENIADLGGLNISFTALQNVLKKNGRAKIDGLSPEQRFFYSYTQVWKTKIRPEYQRMLITIDPHSPAHFRVNGPLRNIKEFAAAFNLPLDCPMQLPAAKQARIW